MPWIAMPTGGKLTVGAARDSTNRITITVSDTGYGIDAETARKIFQTVFYRKEEAWTGSWPFYLRSDCQSACCGKITLQSKAGRGTTFAVCLPLDSNPATEKRTETTTLQKSQSIDR